MRKKRPVGAVQVLLVELLLHLAPGVVEEILPLGHRVDRQLGAERDRLGAGLAAAVAPTATAAAFALLLAAAEQAFDVEVEQLAVALHHHDLFAVAAEGDLAGLVVVQLGQPARFVVAPLGEPQVPFVFDLGDVDHRFAVGRHVVVGDRRRAQGQPGEAGVAAFELEAYRLDRLLLVLALAAAFALLAAALFVLVGVLFFFGHPLELLDRQPRPVERRGVDRDRVDVAFGALAAMRAAAVAVRNVEQGRAVGRPQRGVFLVAAVGEVDQLVFSRSIRPISASQRWWPK